MSVPRLLRRSLFPAALALATLAPPAPAADACAVLPSNGAPAPPDLSEERVLLMFDRRTQTEHFVREVRFERVTTRFAFLVPTPSKPEVEKVAASPFDALASNYPFSPPEPAPLFAGSAKSASRDSAVEVHEVKRIGSFTAFVLSATDAAALDAWFAENDIARPPNAIQWLQHFVEKKFFMTAFRYEPPESAGGGMDAETVRLSFKTKDAYYPYVEPLRTGDPIRRLTVWTIAAENLVPAALFAPKGAPLQWRVAWHEGGAYNAGRGALKEQLPGVAAFLPGDGSLRVQTFLDTRGSRNGVSDVVLANEGDSPRDQGFLARAGALLGSLDKPLHDGANDPLPAGSTLDVFKVHPISRGCSCGLAGTGAGDGLPSSIGAVAALAGLLAIRRRRRDV
jgi:hypothetical protein